MPNPAFHVPLKTPSNTMTSLALVTPFSRNVQSSSSSIFVRIREEYAIPSLPHSWRRRKTRMEVTLLARHPSTILVLMHPWLVLRLAKWVAWSKGFQCYARRHWLVLLWLLMTLPWRPRFVGLACVEVNVVRDPNTTCERVT